MEPDRMRHNLLAGGMIGLLAGILAFLLEMSVRFLYLYFYTGEQPPVGYLPFLTYYALVGLLVGVAASILWQITTYMARFGIAVRVGAGSVALALVTAVVALVAAKLEMGPRVAIRHVGTAVLFCTGFSVLGWTLVRLRKRYGTRHLLAGALALFLALTGGHFLLLRTLTVEQFLTEIPATVPGTGKPNILLLTIDTLRADRLGAYGYHGKASENIDRLAREGVLFENATAHSPWTRASFGSIMTSTYPSQHGAFMLLDPEIEASEGSTEEQSDPRLYNSGLRDDATTMAEMLRRHGYRNVCLQTNPNASMEYGFDRGFHLFLYHELFAIPMAQRSLLGRYLLRIIKFLGWTPGRPFRYEPPNADEVYHAFSTLFSHGLPEPFFIWINFMDPHAPYLEREGDVPAEQAHVLGARTLKDDAPISTLSDAYDGEIRFADHYVGRILDLLRQQGVLDQTVVIFTSDHGEEFEDHQVEIRRLRTRGRFHGHSLYGELLNVPLIIRYPPRVPPGLRIDMLVRHVDLLPTVLELAAIENGSSSQGFEGSSLLPSITNGDGGQRPRLAYGERNLYGRQQRSVRDDRYKLIVELGSGNIELYDIRADPEERVNLAAAQKDEADRLLGLLDAWAARMGPLVPPSSKPATTSPEAIEQLRALGYVQ